MENLLRAVDRDIRRWTEVDHEAFRKKSASRHPIVSLGMIDQAIGPSSRRKFIFPTLRERSGLARLDLRKRHFDWPPSRSHAET
jgi:hypothetical protein